jgi:hypothetical protein
MTVEGAAGAQLTQQGCAIARTGFESCDDHLGGAASPVAPGEQRVGCGPLDRSER